MISNAAFTILLLSLLIFIAASVVIIIKPRYGLIGIGFCVYWIVFFIAPALFHVKAGVFPFYSMMYSDFLQDSAALAVFLFSIFSLLGFFLAPRRNKNKVQKRTWGVNKRLLGLFVLFSVMLQAVLIVIYGVDSFIVSRREFSFDGFGGDSIAVAVVSFARSLSFLTLIIFFCLARNLYGQLIFWVVCAVLALLFLVINYPLALPRYIFFSYVLSAFYIFMPSGKMTKIAVFSGFILGVTTIFPALSSITRGDGYVSSFDVVEYYSSSGDFDGFQSTINTISYVEKNGISWGWQSLGAALIFVPRYYWSGKPIATGEMAAEFNGYQFTNISSPLVAEIFVDFGWSGILFLSFLVGWGLREIDRKSLQSKAIGDWAGIIFCAAVFSVLIIVMRGALIGIIANVVLFVSMSWVFTRFVLKGGRL